MIKSIIKRDGRVVLYDEGKIASAILKAMEAAQEGDASQAAAVANAVEAALEERCGAQPPQIEQIQDEVESQLMQMGFDNAAKKYILYRASRTRVREMNTRLMKVFDELTHADATASDMKRSNANIDGDTPMGTMLQYGSEAAKDYYDKYLLTPEQSRAHREGWIDPSSPSGHECIHLCQRRAQGRRHGNASVSPHAQVDIFDPFSLKLIPHTACGAILRGFFVFHPTGSSCSFPAAARRGGGFLCIRVPGPLRTRALEHYTPTQMQLANPPKMPRKFSMDSA